MQSPSQPSTHRFDILQLVFTGLGILALWGMAASILAFGILGQINNGGVATIPADLLAVLTVSASFLAMGVILLPGIILPLRNILGKTPLPTILRFSRAHWLILAVWPLLLLSGTALRELGAAGFVLFPLIHVLAVILPVILILAVAIRGIPFQSPQRAAGLTMTGMIGGTAVSFVLETMIFLVIGVGFVILLIANPAWLAELNRLISRLMVAGDDLEAIQRMLLPYLSRPEVLGVILVAVSGFIPLIEEVSKTIGFWFLVRKEWTISDGYIGGLFSGAGFALSESLIASSQMAGDAWLVVVITRVGTALMHIFASGLVGMGLIYAWKNRNPVRMVLLYLAAVSLHGLWNLVAILLSFVPGEIAQNGFLSTLGTISPFMLGVLSLGALSGLFALNRHFRKGLAAG